MSVTTTTTVTWHETLFAPCCIATSSSHPVQGQVWEISASFLPLYALLQCFVARSALVPLQPVWSLKQRWVLTPYCCATTNRLSSSLCALLFLFSCFGHACNLFIISWWDIHDHSGSGALPVGGRAQRSLRRRTLNMRTKSLWDCEYLDTQSRTMTHHPSSRVPCRASSRVIVRRWDGGFCSRVLQLSCKGHMSWAGWQAQHGHACDELEPEDVATADGVNMILDILAEVFQGEYDVDGSHRAGVRGVQRWCLLPAKRWLRDGRMARVERCSATCDGLRHRSRHVVLQAPAMEKVSSVLALRTRCRTAARAVHVRERRRSIASGASGTHGLHAAWRAEEVSTIVRFEKGHWTSCMPDHKKTSVQRWRGEDIILCVLRVRPQHVRLHWQGCDWHRMLTLPDWTKHFRKWRQMLTRRWSLSTRRSSLRRSWPSVLTTMRHWEQDSDYTPCWNCRSQWSIACVCEAVERIFNRPRLPYWSGTRTSVLWQVAGTQNPVWNPVTHHFWRMCNLPCHMWPVPDRTKYIRGSHQHLTIKHLKPIAPTLNPCMERMDRRKTPVMKRETTGKTEKEDGWECTVSPDEHYSAQCTTNHLFFAITSLNAGRERS